MEITRKQLYQLSWLTLVGFSFLGALINFLFIGKRPIELFYANGPYPLYQQIGVGLAFGIVAGLVALVAIKLGLAKKLSNQLTAVFAKDKLSVADALFFSFCAGFGEEVFFRGAIQPFLGIWPTAIIFVGIHGYLNYREINVFIYGILMVLISGGMGYLYEYMGLAAAISTHFIFDVIMFLYLIFTLRDEQHS